MYLHLAKGGVIPEEEWAMVHALWELETSHIVVNYFQIIIIAFEMGQLKSIKYKQTACKMTNFILELLPILKELPGLEENSNNIK